jgi:large subunit ribosomal protein L3
MTAIWDEKGNRLPVTILQVERAQVCSVKTMEKHGYWAVQMGIGYRNPRNVTKAMLGHFATAQVAPKMNVGEFRVRDESGLLPVGIIEVLHCSDFCRDGIESYTFHRRSICRHPWYRVRLI